MGSEEQDELTDAAHCVLAWIDRKTDTGRLAAERLERALAGVREAPATPFVLGADGTWLTLEQFRAWSVKQQTCRHKSEQESHEAECFICGTFDCPTACELHYHHDGCADCGAAEKESPNA